MSVAPIRVAVLGLGRMGRQAHFERLAADARFEVVAVVDSDKATREQVAQSVGGLSFESLDAFMVGPFDLPPELVINAMPSHLHVEPSAALLNQGYHVVVEKPLAPDASQARPSSLPSHADTY